VELDRRIWTVEVAGGGIDVRAGEPTAAEVSIRTDPETLVGLLEDPRRLDAAVSDQSVVVEGDLRVLRRVLQMATTAASPAAAGARRPIGYD
jgi:ubiquinone biosynthesis protein UbiJ